MTTNVSNGKEAKKVSKTENESSISTGMNKVFKKLDVEKPIDLSAKSIAKGMNKTFRNLDGKSICRRCNGKGHLISYITKSISCERCNGKGWVVA